MYSPRRVKVKQYPYAVFVMPQIATELQRLFVILIHKLHLHLFHKIKTTDMKKIIILMSAMLIQTVAVSVFAQDKPVAGDTISGRIYDNDRPMKRVLVLECNAKQRVITRCYTDSTGLFSFKLVDPCDHIQIWFDDDSGSNIIEKPINKRFLDINIREEDIIPFNIVF